MMIRSVWGDGLLQVGGQGDALRQGEVGVLAGSDQLLDVGHAGAAPHQDVVANVVGVPGLKRAPAAAA